MITYCELSIPLRCLVLLGFFLEVCLGGVLAGGVYLRKKPWVKVVFSVLLAVSVFLMVVYTAQARSELRSLAAPGISGWLISQSVLLSVGWLILAGAFFGWLYAEQLRYHRSTITRSSIKEGVDRMSSGLCFYEKGGRVVLVNSCMNELSHLIAGTELSNAEEFWDLLSGGEVRSGVERISFGSYPNFRLKDGRVWTFTREKIEGFIQLTAADTTLQQSLTDELREKNLDLAAMNLRLRRHGENADELVRTRERLETKVRIHSELGHALLATRSYLVNQAAGEPPIAVWRRNIAMLRKELESGGGGDPAQILEKAALAAGIDMRITGNLPDDTEYRQFFLTAASEAMTNAVRHGGAKSLVIRITGDAARWSMRFTNDGALPEGPVTEGGGLSSLRRKAEYIGAVMTVECAPEFALNIVGGRGFEP